MPKGKKKEKASQKYDFQANAGLILSKIHLTVDNKASEAQKKAAKQKHLIRPVEKISHITFDVREITRGDKDPLILTPRIDLEGSFFADFLTSGRPEQYEISLEIKARRTNYKPKGIPTEESEPEETEGVFEN